MFNKFFSVVLAVLFLVSFASGLKIVFPVEAEVLGGSPVELGSVSPGQTFELIVFDERFDSIELQGKFSDWPHETEFYEKNTAIRITVPKEISLGTKSISFKAFDSKNESLEQSFNAVLNVRKDLWSVNVSDLVQETRVDVPAKFDLTFSNESIAGQKIIVFSSLPSFWLNQKTFVLEPKSVSKQLVVVNPRHYGQREFDFVFDAPDSSEQKKFRARLLIESSLSSKYSSPAFGFPFFTPSLYSFYLFSSGIAVSMQSLLEFVSK
ncbi:MAG: hypothetical protein ABIJ74_03205 [archaeon]